MRALAVLAVLAVTGAVPQAASADDPLIVHTRAGVVHGQTASGVDEYLG
jgi:hypothetical protein